MFLGATIFSAILLHKVYLFQKLAEFDQAREGKLMDIIIYGLPFSFLYTVKSDLFRSLTQSSIISLMNLFKNTILLHKNILVKLDPKEPIP